MKIPTLIAVVAVSLATVSLASHAGGTKLYKWKDKNGVVHYGTSIPPQYAQQKSEVLNAQGTVVKTIQAPKTPAQIAAEEKQKAAAKEQARQEAAQRQHDQVLLDTYTSVADMQRDMNSRISAIDSQINVTTSSISGLQSSLADYENRASRRTKAGKPVPADVQQKLDDLRDQLATNQKLLMQQEQKEQAIRSQFKADIARFKELQAEQATN